MRIMKYVFGFLFCFFMFFQVHALEFDLQSNYALLSQDGDIVYEKDADEQIQIASLTKIMTAIVTLEQIDDLDATVTITSADLEGLAEENLVTAGFMAGDVVTYRDLLYGLLLPSGADAAKALSRLVGGSEEEFVALMNTKAEELELSNTHFANPIGLDDENNYSTVSDVYQMFSYAVQNDIFKEIITSSSYQTTNGLTLYSSVLKTDNEYILGGKTGTTDGAGLCLASIASIHDHEFILVTAGAPYDKLGSHHLEDAQEVYNYIADNYNNYTIVKQGDELLTLKTVYAKNDEVTFYATSDIQAFLANDYDSSKITYQYEGASEVTTDLEKGEQLGTLNIYYEDDLIANVDILLAQQQQFSLFKYLLAHKIIVISAITLIILLIIFVKRCFKRPAKIKNML